MWGNKKAKERERLVLEGKYIGLGNRDWFQECGREF